jgi:abortive infection alpha-like protein
MSNPGEWLSEIAKVLTEPINNLLSPPSKEMGDLLGTIANLCRFYATDNLAKIFEKWAEYRRGERPLNGEDFRQVMPLLPAASMVSDDELQEKWARLLESAVNRGGHSPAFGQTLAQLSVEDVRFLDTLWAVALIPLHTHVTPTQPLSFFRLVRAFDPGINTGVNDAEFRVYGHKWSDEQKANYEKLKRAKLTIDNVIRLGILKENRKIKESDRTIGLNDVSANRREVKIKAGDVKVEVEYSFNPFGVSFMEAVTGEDKDFKG